MAFPMNSVISGSLKRCHHCAEIVGRIAIGTFAFVVGLVDKALVVAVLLVLPAVQGMLVCTAKSDVHPVNNRILTETASVRCVGLFIFIIVLSLLSSVYVLSDKLGHILNLKEQR